MKKQTLQLALISTLVALALTENVRLHKNRLTQAANQDKCVFGKCIECRLTDGCEDCIRSKRVESSTSNVFECVDGDIPNCWRYAGAGWGFTGCAVCENGKRPTHTNPEGGTRNYECSSSDELIEKCELERIVYDDRRVLIGLTQERTLESTLYVRTCSRCEQGYAYEMESKLCVVVAEEKKKNSRLCLL